MAHGEHHEITAASDAVKRAALHHGEGLTRQSQDPIHAIGHGVQTNDLTVTKWCRHDDHADRGPLLFLSRWLC
jgi:hypothetical protein